MGNTEKLYEEFLAFTAASKEFIGEFVYEPFGIQSSEMLNSITLYAGLGIVALLFYRISRPAPHARYRHKANEYDFGRNV